VMRQAGAGHCRRVAFRMARLSIAPRTEGRCSSRANGPAPLKI
jgi:hypothetical protein